VTKSLIINISKKTIATLLLLFSATLIYAQEYTSTIVWDNGEKREEGIIKNGKQNGLWNFWNEKVELTEARFYVKGEIYSRTKYFYKSEEKGFLYEIKHYNYDNVLTRYKTYTSKDTSSFYAKFYYENSTLKSEGKVSRNKNVDEWKYYHEYGTLKETRKFNNKKYLLTKLWKDGGKKEEGIVYFDEKVGEWNKWNSSNDLVETINYKADTILTKTKNEYYTHTKGLLYQQNTYSSKKILLEKKSYDFQENNKYILTTYYESGNKKSQGKVVSDEQVGKWNYFNEDGSIVQEELAETIKKMENNLIIPTTTNSIIKIYRTKRYPPSTTLGNGHSVNGTDYLLFINDQEINTIYNGSYFEFEITKEGLYTIEASITKSKTINLFVKLGRTYFLKCDLLPDERNGTPSLMIIDSKTGIEETTTLKNIIQTHHE